MDLLMIVYTVLTAILSAIMLEEVRDLHYFPLLGTLGLTVVGIVLAGGAVALIPPAFTTSLTIALAVASTILAATFFYDLRKIGGIERDAIIYERKARLLHEHNTAFHSSAVALQNRVETQTAATLQASGETARSIEAIHVG